MEIIWFLVNCNSQKEAEGLGRKALTKRLAACVDILPRTATYYFWPPKSAKISRRRGCLLVLNTLPRHCRALAKLVKTFHRDKVPFFAALELDQVNPAYVRWLKGEVN